MRMQRSNFAACLDFCFQTGTGTGSERIVLWFCALMAYDLKDIAV